MNTHIENIIADIKRGNKQAFKKLFDDYYPILCVFSFHYVEDKEVCKDIVQDALLAYWERKEDFNDILKVKSFLYTVTRNKCLNYLKHAQLDIPFFHGFSARRSGRPVSTCPVFPPEPGAPAAPPVPEDGGSSDSRSAL